MSRVINTPCTRCGSFIYDQGGYVDSSCTTRKVECANCGAPFEAIDPEAQCAQCGHSFEAHGDDDDESMRCSVAVNTSAGRYYWLCGCPAFARAQEPGEAL